MQLRLEQIHKQSVMGNGSTPSVLIFASCPEAKQNIYPLLTFAQVATCKQNLTLFYQNPQAQRDWQGVILHPVCLMIVKEQKR